MRNTLQKSTKQEQTPTTLAVLQTYNDNEAFTQIALVERTLSPKEILENCSTIINLKLDDKSVINQIKRIINLFLALAGKDLQDFQINILANDLFEKFKTDTFEDIILMFKMARQGEFGKIYRGDLLEINSWVPLYLDFKAIEREKLVKKIPVFVEEKEQKPPKAFHELPLEMQEKFNNFGLFKEAKPGIVNDEKRLLESNNYLRDLAKKLTNKEK